MRVVLVSKGPSARHIPKSDEYKIAALNDAIILCEEVDYFFVTTRNGKLKKFMKIIMD